MLSDSDGACMGIALALCLKRKWIATGLTNGTNEDHITHMKSLQGLRLSKPNDYKHLLRLSGQSFDELLKIVSPAVTKRNTTLQEAVVFSHCDHCD